jgi:error-prone DNA polymerase
VSFAHLVYSSAWLKLHYPAAFCAALLNAQPMGFWSPASLVADVRRHGVVVHGPDVNASEAKATLQRDASSASGFAIRLGLSSVRTVGEKLAASIAERRPFRSIEDLVRKTGAGPKALGALAAAGAFGCFDVDRRGAMWSAGIAARARAETLPGIVEGARTPPLSRMSRVEVVASDLWATGVSSSVHPIALARERLARLDAVPIASLSEIASGTRVFVAGTVTHRQRPSTANGTVFLCLEDETGLLNVTCSRGMWLRYREVGRTASSLVVRGRVERQEGAINLVAEDLRALALETPAVKSRDFR